VAGYSIQRNAPLRGFAASSQPFTPNKLSGFVAGRLAGLLETWRVRGAVKRREQKRHSDTKKARPAEQREARRVFFLSQRKSPLRGDQRSSHIQTPLLENRRRSAYRGAAGPSFMLPGEEKTTIQMFTEKGKKCKKKQKSFEKLLLFTIIYASI